MPLPVQNPGDGHVQASARRPQASKFARRPLCRWELERVAVLHQT